MNWAGWPGSRGVRDPGLSFLNQSRCALSITARYDTYFYPEVNSNRVDKFPTVIRRTHPGLEPRETRGTQRSHLWRDLKDNALAAGST